MAEGGSAVLLVSHGSPEQESNDQFLKLRDRLRAIKPGWRIEAAFLERALPSFHDELADLAAEGVTRVAVLPVFLFPGRHVDEDIPAEIADVLRKKPNVKVDIGPTLCEHDVLSEILAFKIPTNSAAMNPNRVILAAAGSVAVQNRRALEELTMKVQRRAATPSRYAYLDMGEPLIEDVLREVIAERPPKVAVVPCILFPGMYHRQLKDKVAGFQAAHRTMPITLDEPFGLHHKLTVMLVQDAAKLLAGGAPAAA